MGWGGSGGGGGTNTDPGPHDCILNFVSEEKADGLHALLAAVDVITKEQVVSLGGEAAVPKAECHAPRASGKNPQRGGGVLLEETEKIVILAMDVAADLDGGLELEKNRLGHEHVPRVDAQVLDLIFGQLHLRAYL